MELVYIDVLAGINFVVDYLLLAATARLCGIYARRLMLVLGSALGALYAMLTVFPLPALVTGLPAQLVVGFAMVVLALGRGTGLAKRFLLFLLVSFAFAGCTSALYLATGTRLGARGVYYFDIPLHVVLGSCTLAYVLSGLLFRGAAKHGVAHNTLESATLTFGGKSACFQLLLDTGNDLTDPMSGRPALLLERRAAARLLPAELLFVCTALESGNSADILSRIPPTYATKFRLLPYCAVGTCGGLLLMFRPDSVLRGGGIPYDAYVAISPQPIAGGRYEGLIGI